ncbi:MAG: hypothetical protein J5967_00855 [Oscillospiraceae bacterium]|nr:hypothetical protein [Oscillospiraceae bacterium]
MFYRLSRQFGKPVCVALYGAFAYLAAKKKPVPLLTLAAMHLTEYFVIGRKVAAEHGLGLLEGFFQCLAFGYTWWLPLKKGD